VPIRIGIKLNLIQIILAIGLASASLAAGGKGGVSQDAMLVWAYDAPWFGGISGAEISADGQELTAITDHGRVIRAEMVRERGVLVGLKVIHSVALRDPTGQVLAKPFTDAEGLAVGKNGQAYVSFEGQHRITTLDISNGVTTPVTNAPGAETLSDNAGIEALAIHPDGTLFALPEESGKDFFPLYAYRDGAWVMQTRIPRRGPFLPVGADFDDAGNLYLLERTVTPLGFRSRIRRFDLNKSDLAAETLMQSFPAHYDNLEAISVWRDPAGRTRLTVLSDDNFLAIQQTQVIEFIVAQ
tara:strand:- start:12155 stop:13048 length:894 start_codon:yes stop_codon:yes gene_type:complete